MHTALPRQRTSLSVLLAIASLALVLICFAPTAHAYEQYSCKSCAQESGKEFHVAVNMRNKGTNESGKGVCSVIWGNKGNGSWEEWPDCSATESELYITIYGTFSGHGQVRRYYKEHLYNLFGTEEEAGASGVANAPANTTPADTVGGNKVFVFQRTANLETQTCVADDVTGAEALACSPVATAEREGVDIVLPNPGGTPTVVALVPNGVSSVTFDDALSASSVAVTNHVAVAEGAVTGYRFVTPTGVEEALSVPQG